MSQELFPSSVAFRSCIDGALFGSVSGVRPTCRGSAADPGSGPEPGAEPGSAAEPRRIISSAVLSIKP